MSSTLNGFPSSSIEERLAREARSLVLTEDEVDSLPDYRYSDRYTFSMLSLLYPGMSAVRPDVDHLFPRALFSTRELKRNEIPETSWTQYRTARDRLGNLQLLEAVPNVRRATNRLTIGWGRRRGDRCWLATAFLLTGTCPNPGGPVPTSCSAAGVFR